MQIKIKKESRGVSHSEAPFLHKKRIVTHATIL
jgi:hypothetical protein